MADAAYSGFQEPEPWRPKTTSIRTARPGDPPVCVEHVASFAVIRVSGEIDISTAPYLRRALAEIQNSAADVAVDLSAVEYLDSSGLNVFVEAHRRASDDGGRFVLVGVGDGPRRLMQLTGLERVLSFIPDLAALPLER